MPTHKGKYTRIVLSLSSATLKVKKAWNGIFQYLKSKQTMRTKTVMPKSYLSEMMKNMNIFHIFKDNHKLKQVMANNLPCSKHRFE